MARKEIAGLGYVVLAVAFFATSPVLVRWAAPLSPFEITFGRLATAAAIVLLLERITSRSDCVRRDRSEEADGLSLVDATAGHPLDSLLHARPSHPIDY